MPAIRVTFGYYPVHTDLQTGDISLIALPGLQQTVKDVEASEGVVDRWIYAPSSNGRSGRIFRLPKTHSLNHENADSVEHLEFLVWCFSFFVGMRLTTTEAGFLDATPIKPRTLTDLVLSENELSDLLSLAESFWQKHHHNPRDVKRVVSIIHALFLAQYPLYLQVEEFTYLYIALDACYALAKSMCGAPPKITHARRLDWICKKFGLAVPSWAIPGASKATEVSAVRNHTLHEALFFEEPLGFSTYGGKASQKENVPLEMQALICRLLVALLGKPKCYYVSSPVNTGSMFGLYR